MTGKLFFLVGNSGSGKDSLLNEIQQRWPSSHPNLYVPTRYITRPTHETEPFYSITIDEFQRMKKSGKFCFSWHIYDTHYGVPEDVIKRVKNGEFCIINVSRTIIKEIRKKYPKIKVIFVHVPFEITKQRIHNRGRESTNSDQFKKRLARAKENEFFEDADHTIDNSGDLSNATEELFKYLKEFV